MLFALFDDQSVCLYVFNQFNQDEDSPSWNSLIEVLHQDTADIGAERKIMSGVLLSSSNLCLYHFSDETMQVSMAHREGLITTGNRLLQLSQQFIDKIRLLGLTIYKKNIEFIIILTYRSKLLRRELWELVAHECLASSIEASLQRTFQGVSEQSWKAHWLWLRCLSYWKSMAAK